MSPILLPMMLIFINTNIPTVNGRFAACVNSRAADTFADNRVARTGLALQVPPAWSSTAGAADAAHDTHEQRLHCNSSSTGGRGEALALGNSRFLSSLTKLSSIEFEPSIEGHGSQMPGTLLGVLSSHLSPLAWRSTVQQSHLLRMLPGLHLSPLAWLSAVQQSHLLHRLLG